MNTHDLTKILDEKFEQQAHIIGAAFEQQQQYMDKRFDAINKKFEEVDKRFEEVDKRFEEVDKRFEEVQSDIHTVQQKVDRVHDTLIHNMDYQATRNEEFAARLDKIEMTVFGKVPA